MINKIKAIVNSDNNKLQLKWIYIIATINIIVLTVGCTITCTGDTPGYLSAGKVFFDGALDYTRTPIYPVICELMKRLLGQALYLEGVVILQVVVFLVSIYYFYQLCLIIVKHRATAFITSVFYVVVPAIHTWSFAILSESLSISLAVMWTYYAVRCYYKPCILYATWHAILLMVLVFLRPSFMYLLPVSVIYWIYLIYKHRTISDIVGLLGIVVTVAALFLYSNAYKAKYHIFSTNCVGLINQYYMLREAYMIDTISTNNAAMNHDLAVMIDETPQSCAGKYKIWFVDEFGILSDKYGTDQVQALIKVTMQKHMGAYLKTKLMKVGEYSNTLVWQHWLYNYRYTLAKIYYYIVGDILNIRFSALYFLLGAYLFFYFWRRKLMRHIPIITIFLWTIICANLGTVVLGAQCDWNRLMSASAPHIFILLALALEYIVLYINNYNKK